MFVNVKYEFDAIQIGILYHFLKKSFCNNLMKEIAVISLICDKDYLLRWFYSSSVIQML